MTNPAPQEGELILYRTADDAVRVEVLYESETFWLDQRRMAELFGVDVRTVSEHLRDIYASGDLRCGVATRLAINHGSHSGRRPGCNRGNRAVADGAAGGQAMNGLRLQQCLLFNMPRSSSRMVGSLSVASQGGDAA